MGRKAMRWTTLVNHSQLERKGAKAKKRWLKELDRVEDVIANSIAKSVPTFYAKIHKCTDEYHDVFDIASDESLKKEDFSLMTVDYDMGSDSEIVGLESVENETTTSSHTDAYYSTTKETKLKSELFGMEMSLSHRSTDESVYEETKVIEKTTTSNSMNNINEELSIQDVRIDKVKAFTNFLNKTNNEIRANWVTFTKKESDITVTDDEKLIYEIASKFCTWAEKEGLTSSVLTIPTIMDLFRFKFSNNVVIESMMLNIQQLHSVASKIVKQHPQHSERAELFRQILWDQLNWSRPKQNRYVFNSTKHYRKPREKVEPIKHWLQPTMVPEQLKSGEYFFKPLLDSIILEKFTIWLLENENSYRPEYLKQIGYFYEIIKKHGGMDRIMKNCFLRKKRMKFNPKKYSMAEDKFIKTIKRMADILNLKPGHSILLMEEDEKELQF